jgi:hypothetical protein
LLTLYFTTFFIMTIDLNATLIAYVFLSCFDLVSERERDVVCFVLDLLSSYVSVDNVSLLSGTKS